MKTEAEEAPISEGLVTFASEYSQKLVKENPTLDVDRMSEILNTSQSQTPELLGHKVLKL